MRARTLPFALLTVALLGGCRSGEEAALTDDASFPDTEGASAEDALTTEPLEPFGPRLGSLHGRVLPVPGYTAPALEVRLLWFSNDEDLLSRWSDPVPLVGALPSDFTIGVDAPPAGARVVLPDGGTVALAWVFTVEQGEPERLPENLWHPAPDVMVAYLEADALPGSDVAALVGGALPAGLHVLAVEKQPEAEVTAIVACEDAGADECAALVDPEQAGACWSKLKASCGVRADRLLPAPDGLDTEILIHAPYDPPSRNHPVPPLR